MRDVVLSLKTEAGSAELIHKHFSSRPLPEVPCVDILAAHEEESKREQKKNNINTDKMIRNTSAH